MTAPHDLDRELTAFLEDGPTALPDASFDAVRDRTEASGQRVVIGPWMAPVMNRFAAIGLVAASVVAVLIAGSIFLGMFGPPPGGEVPESVAPSDAGSSVEASPPGYLPVGRFAWFVPADPPEPPDDGPTVTVTIPAEGWTYAPDSIALVKGNIDRDPPRGTGAFLIVWSTYQGTYVYGDPCHWASTQPDVPATTVEEIVAALAAQPSRGLSEPEDVMVGGYAGQKITLHVPNDTETRGDAFADCDEHAFASFGMEGVEGPLRWHQGPGQIDEFWVLDVEGAIVIIDGAYSPATPAELVAEVRAIAESATFE